MHYTVDAASANPVGELILRTVFFRAVGKNFGGLVDTAAAFARRDRDMPSEIQPPRLDEAAHARLERAVAAIEATPHAHGLARRLADYATTRQEVDVVKIRPLALARRWNVGMREAVEACLEATRAGLFDLRWDLLCPRCRVAKSISLALDELPTGAHCGTCNIDYERDFSRNVELSFQPSPGIR